MTAAGYSGTPLAKKLGLRPGQVAGFLNLPDELAGLTEAEALSRADVVSDSTELAPMRAYDVIHAFYRHASEMRAALQPMRAAIKPAGMIWVSWPKQASKVATDITEDVIRDAALATGLVDVKVCAVTEVWSGLKLVIPLALRPQTPGETD